MNLATLLDPLALAILLVMTVLFPWLAVMDHCRLLRRTADGLPAAKLLHYRWIIAWEWGAVALFLVLWFLAGRQIGPLGLVPDPAGLQWIAVAFGFVLAAIMVMQLMGIRRNPKSLAGMRDKFDDLAAMVPGDPGEQRAFDRLSITSGICEEVLYRGFLLAILAAAVGTWPAVLLSSVIFGLGHLYQGRLGFLKTTAVGLALALLTVFSGSLITAVLVHIVMDLTSGRLMRMAIELPAEDSP